MKVRKQVYDLLPQDLDECPVWEFALDEEGEENQDEATVRPFSSISPVDPTSGMFIVKAKFTLADGSLAYGYLTPPASGDSDLGTIQPVVVTALGQVGFWCGGVAPPQESIAQSYSRLSKMPSQVFPITFESVVPVSGGAIHGALPGFLVLEDWETGRTRTVQ